VGYVRTAGMSTAARRRRRRTALVLTALVVLLLVVFLYAVAYFRGWLPGTGESAGDATTATATASPTLQPGDVIVNVYNATERPGLASRTADALRAYGYAVDTVDNDREGREVGNVGIYFGPEGEAAARLLQTTVPAAELVPDTRGTAEVDLVLGENFEELVIPESTATETGG
jgi:uncharacterized membrane protein (DUF485 family)